MVSRREQFAHALMRVGHAPLAYRKQRERAHAKAGYQYAHGEAVRRSGSTGRWIGLHKGVATIVAAEGTSTAGVTTIGVASIVTAVALVGGAELDVASGSGVVWMYTAVVHDARQ